MRLDVELLSRSLAKSRTLAARLVEEGAVSVNGTVVTKPSFSVTQTDEIVVSDTPLCRFVSRGALKLAAAIEAFDLAVEGKTAFDFGASTGGFTDCLLQNGVRHVFAVDVGKSQLDERLRGDARISVMEETDARTLVIEGGAHCDLGVMDVSFISQALLYESCALNLSSGGVLVTLYKPQFEVGRVHISKGGIVRDRKIVDAVRGELIEKAAAFGLVYQNRIPSPILGGDGNYEELLLFVRCDDV